MKVNKLFAALAIMIFTATVTSAQSTVTEHKRIKQGVKSGELTKRETKTLVNQQRDIHYDRKAARADGKVTHKERKHIRKDKRKASRTIYHKKHNNKVRH
jgi:uncharacterized protein (DUF3084 family)